MRMQQPPRLVVITPGRPDRALLLDLLPRLVPAVDVVVLRWPSVNVAETFALARELGRLDARPALSVSDRPDLAVAAGLDAVQLRERSLTPEVVRRRFPGLRLGVSRHDAAGLAAAGAADFALLSPFGPTASKRGVPGLGAEEFGRRVAHAAVPVLALGGLEVTNAPAAIAAGASGVAVIGAVWNAVDPVAAAFALRETIDRARRDRLPVDGGPSAQG